MIYDAVKPTFESFGVGDFFEYHVNKDPGTHNYEIDNRRAMYKFVNKHFNTALPLDEVHSEEELFSERELCVGLPLDQTTIADMAGERARRIAKDAVLPVTTAQKRSLRKRVRESILRVPEYKVKSVSRKGRKLGCDTHHLRVGPWTLPVAVKKFSDHDEVSVVVEDPSWVLRIAPPAWRGTVMFVDILGTGSRKADDKYLMMLQTCGQRVLGIQAAQLLACTQFAAKRFKSERISIEGHGTRSSFAALAAAALEPE